MPRRSPSALKPVSDNPRSDDLSRGDPSTSYRGPMLDSTGDLAFDVRLIPEFDSSSSQCVSDWFLKLELVCRLRRVVDVAAVVPLRLAGGALTVYLELPDEDKRSVEKVKEALLAAFSMEPLEAYDNFSSRKLRNGETPDVFLSGLRKLASLFGGISEKGMMCAFISGLPDNVRQILRASLRLQELSLSQVLAQARVRRCGERLRTPVLRMWRDEASRQELQTPQPFKLIHVPSRWIARPEAFREQACAAPATDQQLTERLIVTVHREAGHPGVRRTLYFVRRRDPMVSKREVGRMLSECDICKSVDPAPAKWKHGVLQVSQMWQSRSSAEVARQLESVFYERGAPEELLADNDTAFRSREVNRVAERWGTRLRFLCCDPGGSCVVCVCVVMPRRSPSALKPVSDNPRSDDLSRGDPSTSYRGPMLDSTGDLAFDVRLIPEFDSSSSQCVSDWFLKLELVCRLRRVVDVAAVIPLRLAGGALTVYLELPDEDKRSVEKVKEALLAAFSMEPLEAYDNFSSRKLRNGETPDVFLSELRKLASLFGGISEKGMMCAFISGLPDNVRQILRASLRLQELSLSQVLAQARGVLAEQRPAVARGAYLGAKQSGAAVNVSERRPTEGTVCAATEADITLDERDFVVTFDRDDCSWRATWKWTNGGGPDVLKNIVRAVQASREIRGPYEEELRSWVEQGWLVPYDQTKYGPAKGLIPPMAIVQRNKGKIRPVMDFRELNAHIETFTAHAYVCADKMRLWRRQGVNLAVVDLKKAYLQIRIDESLWPYQTVIFMGRRYCLTRLGFGLNVAPLVMTTVLNCVLVRPKRSALGNDDRTKLRALSGSESEERDIGVCGSLVNEYSVQASVTLVKSSENKADALTRVPKEWLKPQEAIIRTAYAMAADGSAEQRIAEIHHTAGHPGVRRTHYFVKQSDCQITRRQVQAVVRNCETCKSIDPAPIKWRRGCLSVERVWQRLAMDVTHVGGHSYLTLIDSGPSRSIPVRGAPEEILADNDTAFRSRLLEQLAERWNVRVRFRCAHNPSGNDIVERCHRTVKVIVARKECSVPEAVHLYNITPRDRGNAETAPANTLYAYRIRLRGIDARAPDGHPQSQYKVGDHVWVKPPGARCNTQYHRASVTGIVSDNA
ncbi:hypothetical protein M514_27976, partial [Trichuris suis]